MKLNRTYIVIGGISILVIGYWIYKRYISKKAIVQAKDNELSSNTQIEIPKLYVRAGTNIPIGAIAFVDHK